jgi:hypothetical protein
VILLLGAAILIIWQKTPSKIVLMNCELILHRRIKFLTTLFIVGLFLSGVTAIPLLQETGWLAKQFNVEWLVRVHAALAQTEIQYPFLFYGTDWLAFGHFVIAIAFIGAWREPVRNRWLFDFGLIACALVIPYALVFGSVRGIPLWWRLIDCSFGIIGFIPLWFCRKWACELERVVKG